MINFNTKKSNKILITSALPYVNNVPHLGNIIGCVLSADVFARFARSKYGKENVLYICGTDEHGTTSETKALELNMPVKEVCEKYHEIHKNIYEWFSCSFDKFGRTSSKNNHEIAKEIFLKLDKNGLIFEDDLEQLYCESCNRYLADRFIEGTCPKCSYDSARGDQCDNCSTLLNAIDLINPKCKICGATPTIKKERHLFIDLPKIAPDLQKWMDAVKSKWSQNAKTMTISWLRDGLKPRCITRDLKWGINVPKKNYEHKVFYSWFDAPIGYIGITKDLLSEEEFNSWWHNPANINLYQFMGKDNIPFHTILFPSFLIGANDNYTLLHQISSAEYLNYENTKFSKSRGTGVFGDDAINTGIPSDVWRYYLLSNRPESSDSIFTWKGFQEKTNNELLANLGNFVNRTLTFLYKNFDGVVPEFSENSDLIEFKKKIQDKLEIISSFFEKIEIRKTINEIMLLSKLGNEFFQHREPWKHKEDKNHLNNTLYSCIELVRKLAILIEPYIPNTSKEIFNQLNLEPQGFNDLDKVIQLNHKINQPKVLFKKLEDKEIEKFHNKFAGKQQIIEKKEFSFKDIELRVAQITSVEKHPKADKLYIEQIDLGYEKRQIVSGIVGHYTPEELVGKKIILVANLKPAKLRGVESNGMLLAAQSENKAIGLILAPNSELGDLVFTTDQNEKFSQITIDYFFSIKIIAKSGKVFFDDRELQTSKETLSVDKNITGNVS